MGRMQRTVILHIKLCTRLILSTGVLVEQCTHTHICGLRQKERLFLEEESN